jgi:hypothetical protein
MVLSSALPVRTLAGGPDVKRLKAPQGVASVVPASKAEGGVALTVPNAISAKVGQRVAITVTVISTDSDADRLLVNASSDGKGLKGLRLKYRKWQKNVKQGEPVNFTFSFNAREKGVYHVHFGVERLFRGETQGRVGTTIVAIQ